MRTTGVHQVLALLALALTLVTIAAQELAVQEVQDPTRELQIVDFRDELVGAVNAARAERGLEAMCINRKLMAAAQTQTNDMAENNFVKTTGSDGSTPKSRALAQNMTTTGVAEVVGAGYKTTETILAAWLKSAHVNATIFSSRTFIGPGYTYDTSKRYVHYWALDFSNGDGEVCDDAA